MNRILTVLGIVMAVAVAITLYQVKYEVRQAERQARELNRELAREREAIQVLEAEWSYLNRPARIQDLAERYLGMKPLKAAQIGSLETLPLRPLDAVPAADTVAFGAAGALPGGVPLPTRKPALSLGQVADSGPAASPRVVTPVVARQPRGSLEPLFVAIQSGATP